MRDGHLIAVKQRRDQRRAHAGVLRLGFRGMVDGPVGHRDLVAQVGMCVRLAARRVDRVRRRRREGGFEFGSQQGSRHAACHLAGVVATHAVGQNRETEIRIGEHGVLIVPAHHPRVGLDHDFE